MIRVKPSVSKPSKTVNKKHTKSVNEENIKPVGFNTKGYFDPSEPFDHEYLKVKQQVFEKYRNKKEEIVMLDAKNTNKAAFIQKGMLISSNPCNNNSCQSKFGHVSDLSSNLLKSYLLRKQKKEQMEHDRFLQVPKISFDQISLRNTVMTAKSGTSRQVTSRISTTSVLKIETDL